MGAPSLDSPPKPERRLTKSSRGARGTYDVLFDQVCLHLRGFLSPLLFIPNDQNPPQHLRNLVCLEADSPAPNRQAHNDQGWPFSFSFLCVNFHFMYTMHQANCSPGGLQVQAATSASKVARHRGPTLPSPLSFRPGGGNTQSTREDKNTRKTSTKTQHNTYTNKRWGQTQFIQKSNLATLTLIHCKWSDQNVKILEQMKKWFFPRLRPCSRQELQNIQRIPEEEVGWEKLILLKVFRGSPKH